MLNSQEKGEEKEEEKGEEKRNKESRGEKERKCTCIIRVVNRNPPPRYYDVTNHGTMTSLTPLL